MSSNNKGELYLFDENKVLLKRVNNNFELPRLSQFEVASLIKLQKFGIDSNFMIAGLNSMAKFPVGFSWLPVREVARKSQDQTIRNLAFAAYQLNWDLQTSFCGKCGTETESQKGERAKLCPECGLVIYPRISPAIIVAIVKEGNLLLAHNSNFPEGLYSVLAGFMNPAESFEDCVRREVQEEVGISLKNIKYFGNQSWPYPDSHMVAFTADYDSGEIVVDNDEILTAAWFKPDHLPLIPGEGSISRALIEWFVEKYS